LEALTELFACCVYALFNLLFNRADLLCKICHKLLLELDEGIPWIKNNQILLDGTQHGAALFYQSGASRMQYLQSLKSRIHGLFRHKNITFFKSISGNSLCINFIIFATNKTQ